MKQNLDKAASDFLQSEKGGKMKEFAASPEGQHFRAQYAKEGEALRAAVQRGDMASAEAMLKNIFASSDGQKLAAQLKKFMD